MAFNWGGLIGGALSGNWGAVAGSLLGGSGKKDSGGSGGGTVGSIVDLALFYKAYQDAKKEEKALRERMDAARSGAPVTDMPDVTAQKYAGILPQFTMRRNPITDVSAKPLDPGAGTPTTPTDADPMGRINDPNALNNWRAWLASRGTQANIDSATEADLERDRFIGDLVRRSETLGSPDAAWSEFYRQNSRASQNDLLRPDISQAERDRIARERDARLQLAELIASGRY